MLDGVVVEDTVVGVVVVDVELDIAEKIICYF